jgi:uncharacterized membrane protein
MFIEALVILLVGLITLIVSLPLVYRKVPMNQLYGIRIPAAFESEQRWYEINAYGGRQMAAWSWLIVATGAVGFLIPNDDASIYVVLSGLVILVAVLIPLVRVMRWCRHLPQSGTAAAGPSPDVYGGVIQVPVAGRPGNRLKPGTIIPAFVLVLLVTCFVWYINGSVASLPEHVATHFGADGNPNGWMDRQSYLHFITLLGLTVALAIAALAFGLGQLRNYVAASPVHGAGSAGGKRRNGSWLTGDILWLACLILCFIAGTHYLTVAANRGQPAHLPAVPLAILIAGFAAGNIGWIVLLCFHLTRKPETSPAPHPGGGAGLTGANKS